VSMWKKAGLPGRQGVATAFRLTNEDEGPLVGSWYKVYASPTCAPAPRISSAQSKVSGKARKQLNRGNP
jgi:hypothetical protein